VLGWEINANQYRIVHAAARFDIELERLRRVCIVFTNPVRGQGWSTERERTATERHVGVRAHDRFVPRNAANAVVRQLDDSFIRLLIHDTERHPINASSRRRHPTTRQKRVVMETHRHRRRS
jgi:hypothetical protein